MDFAKAHFFITPFTSLTLPHECGTTNVGVRMHFDFHGALVCSPAFRRLRKIWRMKELKRLAKAYFLHPGIRPPSPFRMNAGLRTLAPRTSSGFHGALVCSSGGMKSSRQPALDGHRALVQHWRRQTCACLQRGRVAEGRRGSMKAMRQLLHSSE